jgi:hypothetical protein
MMRRLIAFILLLFIISPLGTSDAMKPESSSAPKDVHPEWYFPEWLGNSPYALS